MSKNPEKNLKKLSAIHDIVLDLMSREEADKPRLFVKLGFIRKQMRATVKLINATKQKICADCELFHPGVVCEHQKDTTLMGEPEGFYIICQQGICKPAENQKEDWDESTGRV